MSERRLRKLVTMPKRKEHYIDLLKRAFIAGCNFGYSVRLDHKVNEQENLGAQAWVGEISDDELYKRLEEIVNEEY